MHDNGCFFEPEMFCVFSLRTSAVLCSDTTDCRNFVISVEFKSRKIEILHPIL